MAVLNSWQKLNRVTSIWGNGSTGSSTISADPNTRETCTGTAAGTAVTAGGTGLSNGDFVILIQNYGTGEGQWEVNKVASGGGTTSLVMTEDLQYTYVTGAQIIDIPQYTTLTINAFTGTAWDNSTGGVVVVAANVSTTFSGALTLLGGNGSVQTSDNLGGGTGGGFKGGNCGNNGNGGHTGQGTGGLSTRASTANGNGAGGCVTDAGDQEGGAAGHSSTGSGGTGTGGEVKGSADLTDAVMGAGGGGGRNDLDADGMGGGGAGGGIFIVFSKDIQTSAGVNLNGGEGGGGTGNQANSWGGDGSGGSGLFVCETATLGSTLHAATAGNNSDTSSVASDGRFAVHHSGTVTGTTSPTFDDTTDSTLSDSLGNFLAFL